MNRAFTIYWTQEGWENLPEGEPIRIAAGAGFSSKITQGDRVYVTNTKDGQLRLLGGFTVAQVLLVRDSGKPSGTTWDAPEYLVAEDGTSSLLRIRPIESTIVRELRFLNSGQKKSFVALNLDGSVNGQSMRSVRELSLASAEALDSLLETTIAKDWTEDELRASVIAYLEIARRIREGLPVNKKTHYANLAARFSRSEGAFEYRMQNISYVLSLMGREWIPGLAPAKNVGTKVAALIERLIGEIEGKRLPLKAAEALIVAKARTTNKNRPNGNKNPATTTSSVSLYFRDSMVKAWVLNRANGKCEACLEPAPFLGTDGFPFLEVHHVRHLADGGSDTPTNAVALCPNCHRRLHYSGDAFQYRDGLFEKITELVKE